MSNNLFIRTYGIDIDGHVHHHYHQVLIPVFGYIVLHMDNQELRVNYGEALFIPKGVFHQFKASEDFSFLVMNTTQAIPDIADNKRLFTLDQNILNYVNFVHHQLISTHQADVEASMLTLLVQLLARLMNNQPKKMDARLTKVIHHIHQDLSKKHTLQMLADIACLSPSHFKTLFKQQLNCTPLEYVTNLRMKKATALLRHTDLPIAIIVEQCGYQSSASFNKRFYEYHHQSPLQFRRLSD